MTTGAAASTMRAKLVEHDEQLNKIDEFINGNGKPGAKQTLALFEQRLDQLEAKMDGLTKAAWGLAGSIVLALVIFFIMQVIPHVSAGIK